ncbi:Mediator of RNA polymerase II transcription subunit 6 [Binucleata daphniae]
MDNSEHVCFRDQAFLDSFVLNEDNVLEYFSSSRFYDQTCTNEILKMQTKYTNLIEIKEDLNKMKGMQYVLDYCNTEKTLFVINKIDRKSPYDYDILTVYYVMNGTIYQAPTNNTVYKSRLFNAYHHIYNCVDLLENTKFDCFEGFDVTKEEDYDENTIENIGFLYKTYHNYSKK